MRGRILLAASILTALAACDGRQPVAQVAAEPPCADAPPFERIEDIVSTPMCGTRLYIPARWVGTKMVRYGCEDPHEEGLRRSGDPEAALARGEMCRPKGGLVSIRMARLQGSRPDEARVARPEFDRDLPHYVFIEQNRQETDAGTLTIFRSETISRLQNPVPAGDGYLTDGLGTYVLIEPKFRRPLDVPLMVTCDRNPDAQRETCRAYLQFRRYRVGYDFVAARFPRSRWEELDQNVVALMLLITRSEQP